jgi:hypothetical protein
MDMKPSANTRPRSVVEECKILLAYTNRVTEVIAPDEEIFPTSARQNDSDGRSCLPCQLQEGMVQGLAHVSLVKALPGRLTNQRRGNRRW